jgi:hypothetical protein
MTIETAHDAPEAVIDPAEEIHDFLAISIRSRRRPR